MKTFRFSLLLCLPLFIVSAKHFSAAENAANFKSELLQNFVKLHQKQKLIELDNNLAKELHGAKDFDVMVLVTVSSDSHCSFCQVIKKTFKNLAASLQKKDDNEKDFFLAIYNLNQHRNNPKALKFPTIPHCQMFLKDGSIESCDKLITVNSHPAALAMKIRQLFRVDIPVKSQGAFILLCIIFSVIAVAFYIFTLVMTNRLDIFDFKYPIGLTLALIGSFVSSGIFTAVGFVPQENDSYLMIGVRESYLFDALLLTICPIIFLFGILGYGGYFHTRNKKFALIAIVLSMIIYLRIVKIKLPGYGLGL